MGEADEGDVDYSSRHDCSVRLSGARRNIPLAAVSRSRRRFFALDVFDTSHRIFKTVPEPRRPSRSEQLRKPAFIFHQSILRFGQIIPAIVDASNRRHRTDRVIQNAFDDMRRCDLPLGNLGRERASQIVNDPVGHSASLVKL